MTNMQIWEATRTVPKEATKPIMGGRLTGMTDIRPQWRFKVLTENFGPCGIGWKYETVERWTEDREGQVSAHVRINLYIKIDDAWSEAIEGCGGSMLVAKERSGPYHSDEAYKMATTDAISVACKQLGIGADVYMGYSDSKYVKPQPPNHDNSERVKQWVAQWIAEADKIEDDGLRASLTKEIHDAARTQDRGHASSIEKRIKSELAVPTY